MSDSLTPRPGRVQEGALLPAEERRRPTRRSDSPLSPLIEQHRRHKEAMEALNRKMEERIRRLTEEHLESLAFTAAVSHLPLK